MITYEFSGGHIADYTSEAYYRASFLESFALALAEKPENSVPFAADAWTGFFLVMQDFTGFMQALNERAQAEGEAEPCPAQP